VSVSVCSARGLVHNKLSNTTKGAGGVVPMYVCLCVSVTEMVVVVWCDVYTYACVRVCGVVQVDASSRVCRVHTVYLCVSVEVVVMVVVVLRVFLV